MQVAERDGFSLVRAEAAGDGFVEAIAQTRFGGRSLSYYRHNVREQLERLGRSDFFTLMDDGAVIGTYALTPVDTVLDGERVPLLYRSNLSVATTHRGRGLGRWLVESALHWSGEQHSSPLSYGSIEAGNEASLRTVSAKAGIRLATIQNRLVYRQWGRRSAEVIVNPDASQVVSQLETAYDDCDIRFAEPRTGDYFAVCDDSRILAGARVHLNRLDIRDDGFSAGRLYAGLVRLFPPGRRRFWEDAR